MSKRPTSTPASQNILPENIFDTDEKLEHDDEDPFAGSLHNNAFIFNEIVFDEVPHVVDPNNDNNIFFLTLSDLLMQMGKLLKSRRK